MEINFKGGVNIAVKIPKAKYENTVSFYRHILKLDVEEKPTDHPTVSRTHRVAFGKQYDVAGLRRQLHTTPKPGWN